MARIFRSIVLFIFVISTSAFSQSTAFNYGGRLVDNTGAPRTGTPNLRVRLYSSIAPTVVICDTTISSVPLDNGVFNISVDYTVPECLGTPFLTHLGNIFTAGEIPLIEIEDETNMMGTPYPQQAMSPSPLSLYALATTIPDGYLAPEKLQGTLTSACTNLVEVDGAGNFICSSVNTGSFLTGLTAGAGITISGSAPTLTVGITAGGVGTTELANLNVTTGKLANSAVDSTKLADNSVTLSKLADADCANGQVYKKAGGTWTCASDDNTTVAVNTANRIQKVNAGATDLADSSITDTGALVTIANPTNITGNTAVTGNTSTTGTLGVGIATPTAKFEVSGGPAISGGWIRSARIEAGHPAIQLKGSAASNSSSWIEHDDVAVTGGLTLRVGGTTEDLATATRALKIKHDGNVGINQTNPTARLDVVGTFKLVDGSQGAGKVLTSNAAGLSSWQTPGGAGLVTSVTADAENSIVVGGTASDPTLKLMDCAANEMLQRNAGDTAWACVPVPASGVTAINGETGGAQTLSTTTTTAFLVPTWVVSAADNNQIQIPMASTALVTAGLLSNLDYVDFSTAFGWGNHAAAGYVDSVAADAENSIVIGGTAADPTVKLMDCAANEILQRNAGDTAWVCATQVTDTNTTYTASTGVTLSGNDIQLVNDFGASIDSSEITDGTVSLADLDNNAGGNLTTCTNGFMLTKQAGGIGCSAAATGDLTAVTVTANQGLQVTNSAGPVPDLSLMDCAANEILKRNAGDTAWVCSTDAGASGSVATINAQSGAAQLLTINTAATPTGPTWNNGTADTHELQIPMASAATTTVGGLITKAQYDIFNNKLSSSLTSANIFVGSAGNVATARALSGDATISNTGILTIAANAITSAKIANGAVQITDLDNNAGGNISACVNGEFLTKQAGGIACVANPDTDTDTTYTASSGVLLTGTNFTATLGTAIETAEINNDAVTYAKIQNVTTNRLLGRASAGAGNTEEITLGTGLSFTGTTLNVAAGADNSQAVNAVLNADNDGNASGEVKLQINGSDKLVVRNDGKVGIGHAIPDAPLTIGNSSTTRGHLKLYDDGSNPPVIQFNDTRASGKLFNVYSGAPSAGDFSIIDANSGNAVRLLIDTTGNVGIGTATPQSKLHVAGIMQLNSVTGTAADCDNALEYGRIIYDSGSMKFCNGSGWQTLGVSGAGITSFNGLSAGTQTLANGSAGTAPAFSSSGSVHTLNIPMASAGGTVTAGLVSNAEFVGKLNNTLLDSQIFVGNAANVATGVLMSGDAQMSNTGVITISNNAITSAKIANGAVQITDLDNNAGGNISACVNGEFLTKQAGGIACVANPDTDTDTTYTASSGVLLTGTNFTATLGTAIETAEINNDAVTYAKIQNVTTNRLLGRASAGAGNTEEITLGTGLSFTGTTLNVSSSGITSLGGQGGTTQTFAAGAAGLTHAISSAGNTHTLNIPNANTAGVTSGAISKTQYDIFNNKLSATLTSANIFVGSAGNVATARALSGDATISNTGVLTIANNAIVSANITNGTVQLDDIDNNAGGNLTVCTNGQFLTKQAGGVACVANPNTDTNTTYTGSSGVLLTGTNFTATLGTSIETAEITNANVTLAKLAGNSVDSSKIVNGSILYTDTDTNSVQRRVASSCVAGQSIRAIAANGTVTCEVDTDTNTTYTGSSGVLLTGTNFTATLGTSIETAEITNANVTLAKLAADSVDGSKVVNGSLTGADIMNNSLTGTDISSGTIALSNLATNSVNSSKIVDGSITGSDVATGAISPEQLAGYVEGIASLSASGCLITTHTFFFNPTVPTVYSYGLICSGNDPTVAPTSNHYGAFGKVIINPDGGERVIEMASYNGTGSLMTDAYIQPALGLGAVEIRCMKTGSYTVRAQYYFRKESNW